MTFSEFVFLGNLPDGTVLDACFNRSKFVVTTTGTSSSIVEIGQQLAWLGAALRSSPFEAKVTLCSPIIRISQLGSTSSPFKAQIEPSAMVNICCMIEYEINECSLSMNGASGQCWHNMVRNPVMVSGYPILAKHERGLGLEMPLNMIAKLGGSERANEFDGKVFIKGFSSMLIATKLAKDLLTWHYFYDHDGERISYLDHALQSVDNISMSQLHKYRHIVGWSSECMYYAGK